MIVTGTDKDGRSIRLRVKKSLWGEWTVMVHINGKRREAESYYGTDRDDAVATMKSMIQHYGLEQHME